MGGKAGVIDEVKKILGFADDFGDDLSIIRISQVNSDRLNCDIARSRQTCLSLALSRAIKIRSSPRSANASAKSNPSPALPPVIIAVATLRSFRSNILFDT